MKQLWQSFGALGLGLTVVVLLWIQTCQHDALERRLIATQHAVEELAIHGVRASAPSAAPKVDTQEQEALADPQNLLKPRRRSFVKAAKVLRDATLRLKVGSDPAGFNPYIARGADLAEYTTYISDAIAQRDPGDPNRWVPALGIKVTTPDQGQSFEVTLRQGVLWHKPQVDWSSGRFDWLRGEREVTADDFCFVFDVLNNNQVTGRVSDLRNYFAGATCQELSKHRFRVTFKERLFTNQSSVLGLVPAPRWLWQFDEDGKPYDKTTWGHRLNEHWYNQKQLGAGPYRFVEWVPGTKIELARNERYWGESPAYARVLMLVLRDQNAWPRKVKTREIDLTQLQPEQYRTEVVEASGPPLGDARIRTARHDSLGYFYLGWNQDTAYFSDKRVRQAMTLALDRASLVEKVFMGLGRVVSGPFAFQSPCYDASIKPWPFDLQRAGELLDAAGWKDDDGDGIRERRVGDQTRKFEFSLLMYGSSSEFNTIASIYREALLKIGVRLKPSPVEWATMLKKMSNREFDAYTGGWALGWEVDLKQLWHSSEADQPQSSNRIGFRVAEADKIIEGLRREFDPERRVALCHAFHRLVHEEQPYTFIYTRERPIVYWNYMNEPEFMPVLPHRDARYFSQRMARY